MVLSASAAMLGNFSDVVCVDCPGGWVQQKTKKSACVECSEGKRAPTTIAAKLPCENCHAGKYQDSKGATECLTCEPGKFTSQDSSVPNTLCKNCFRGTSSNSTGASKCSACPAGQFQDQPQSLKCKLCGMGQYTNENRQTTCKRCGDPTSTVKDTDDPSKSYQNETGQIGCKICPGEQLASASKDECTNCYAVLNTTNSYFDSVSKTCRLCQGCSEGSFKDLCRVDSVCKPCEIGKYKSSSETKVNNQVHLGEGWNKPCQPCSPCSPGSYRGQSDPCRFTGASSGAPDSCIACMPGYYKSIEGQWDDFCSSCVKCTVGSTRVGCKGDSPGQCVLWEQPKILSISGAGVDSSGTSGNAILNIFGKYFGFVRSGKADAADVVVKYGTANSFQPILPWYVRLFRVGCDFRTTTSENQCIRGRLDCSETESKI